MRTHLTRDKGDREAGKPDAPLGYMADKRRKAEGSFALRAHSEQAGASYEAGVEERFLAGSVYRRLTQKTVQPRKDQSRPGMETYRPAEQEKRVQGEPEAFSRLSNEYGQMELGMDRRKNRLVASVAPQKQADLTGLPADAKRLDARRATLVRGMSGERGRLLVDTLRPPRSAVAFTGLAGRGYRDAHALLREVRERGGSQTMAEVLPFLSVRDEKALLADISRAVLQVKDAGRRTALQVRAAHLHRVIAQKEQRHQELIQRMSLAIARKERSPKGQADDLLTRLVHTAVPSDAEAPPAGAAEGGLPPPDDGRPAGGANAVHATPADATTSSELDETGGEPR